MYIAIDHMAEYAHKLIIDATDPSLTEAQLRRLAMAAQAAHVHALCVLPGRVRQASIMLARSNVQVQTLIGYPSGVHVASVKGLETRLALQDGADVISMVPNVGYVLGDEATQFTNEIAYVAKVLREVAPRRAHTLVVICDLAAMPLPVLEQFGTLAFNGGARGFHLRCDHLIELRHVQNVIDQMRSRLAFNPFTVQTLVPDAATMIALFNAGVDYLITPTAADLAAP